MSLINNGMDAGDIIAMIDEAFDEVTGEFAVNEADERAGVPEEIDDDITEEEYEDILTNDDATNPAGDESIALRGALNSEVEPSVEDEVIDIVMDDEEEEEALEDSDIEEYEEEEDAEIAAILDEDDEDDLV